ncbi:poly [ADP-ribose] polymerase 1-like [Papaver somniferum]|uniref:poly [ADP-ribose] polymerase 1-like n=1 Tax=Papaver somniferum TaxID=3469 RepID=UPI000E6F5B31|nr:poly [ADP-ribose] polymerase 1-like [Papaver somniferum]
MHASGGEIHAKLKQGTNCLVVGAELDCEGHDGLEYKDHFQIIRARKLGLPILRLDYLTDCTKRQKRLPLGQYLIESSYKDSRGSVTMKVNGNCVVHETSGMQGYSHILEGAKYIYSTTLNKSDLSIGVNSYYVMQIIQEDKRTNCYLFREWGRTGNEQIGGNKLDETSKAGAIREFKRLFLEKTGNHWEAWEKKENFQKQPGKYFPLDIDYGVSEQVLKIKEPQLPSSRLAQPVQNLMKMLFNVETYRSAMIELEIDMSEMPLGKLSKSNIQMGFSALTDIQNLLASNNQDLSVRESLLIDASNRFFSIIPSTHPHVEMLEALQDIEIASRIIGVNAECDESLDAKYEKLHCNIHPLPHDSDDYLLVEKYLLTTHASRHKEWTLELEDVFALDREGEFDKFAPYREKLQNKMLLWYGSRLTNFVGILSHGLRIAPPEVPSSGYMFGKGIYFADLVSKSAQYCHTSNWNPVGLLLLSEVALGDIYELKEAMDMDRPPKGKNSTKGLGKKAPHKSDYVTWKNNVVVPCGKPVSSDARTSELMYNEYIVYDAAQVKMQFLVKVRFHHKI